MKVEVIQTTDGSSSLFVPELNETYHSTHGALTESNHVFIKNGLDYYIKTNQPDSIRILEIGFGTGLNALLTADFEEHNSTKIIYHTLEAYPLEEEIIKSLNYPQLVGKENSKELFQNIHQADWEVESPITANFSIQKMHTTLDGFQAKEKYDIIYFDAFAPSKQPEMWDLAVFEKLYSMMNANAILVTYCAQGQFKRNLKSVGFEVESLPGPPRKFEMVRATKHTD